MNSRQLMEKFFERKIWEQVGGGENLQDAFFVTMQTVAKAFLLLLFVPQNVFGGEKYGAVTLLTSYRRSDQRLHVEVLNAVNLLPMDSNGKTVHRDRKMAQSSPL